MTINAIKIMLPAIMTFLIGYLAAPYYIQYLLKNNFIKRKFINKSLDGSPATITEKIHGEAFKGTPRLGGVLIWFSVSIVLFIFWLGTNVLGIFPDKLDFVSRNQTWIIIFAMIFAGILGAIDDISTCGKHVPFIGDKGLSFYKRAFVIFLLSIFIAYWFYFKLGFLSLFVPFFGYIYVYWLIIPIIILTTLVMFTTSVIDGIDGLSGGLFATAFAAYGLIALSQNQIDISAFCFAIVGATIAFLWYNVTPAQFYNSETGLTSLAITITIVAFLTNQLFVLPIIALPLLSGPISGFLQVLSKKIRGKKIFLVAPMHHHFQAKGMNSQTVVMRYWLFAIMCAFLGVIIALAGKL
jgi:phospho-N-acetylmuramoyl-pentapeptide-transferase